jgi:hypothetical protein
MQEYSDSINLKWLLSEIAIIMNGYVSYIRQLLKDIIHDDIAVCMLHHLRTISMPSNGLA